MPMYEQIKPIGNKRMFIQSLYSSDINTLITASGINVKGELVSEKEVELCLFAIPLLYDVEASLHRKTVRSVFSYSLKHVIERFVGHYISNGAAIKACLKLGLEIKSSKDLLSNGSPNCYFKLKPFSDRQIYAIGRHEINVCRLIDLLKDPRCSTNIIETSL
jgi:hypothetical protein